MTIGHTARCIAALLLMLSVGHTQQQPQSPQPKPPETAPKQAPSPKKPRKRVITDLSGFDLLAPKGGHSAPQTVAAGTRTLLSPVPLAPRLARLYSDHPVFDWRYPSGNSKFQFVLKNSDGKEVFRAEVRGTNYQYPSTAPDLVSGQTYFWSVEPASGLLTAGPSDPSGFIVLSSEERLIVEKALAGIHEQDSFRGGLARADVFTDHRLWYDAIRTYSDLIARFPKSAELYEYRGMIYAQLDATKALAEGDFARAEELQDTGKTRN